ncbi:Tetratricopeptide repeat-containing protein [Pseudooceanicola antarcticus]|uniref:Tetratricopeptide repeat-containing protein n=2 Tax=Pseudooceanicola antarcticus TaxID=1247613 RepID=A0A285J2R0_9RHOB|nr:tetratricopeptide repeat protein [Pseudooceanicola antarcticus]SNY54610.1 Tetratricopeptide repeat-containing protein [Pseudooceanicola antarcticus]
MPYTEKVLHGANLLVCAAGLSTATGLVAGTGAVITAGLSARELSRRLPAAAKPLRDEIASRLTDALADQHLPEAHRALIPQMIDKGLPSAKDIMEANREPRAVIAAMLAKLNQPGADPALQPGLLQSDFTRVMLPIMRLLLQDPEQAKLMEAAFQDAVLQHFQALNDRIEKLVAQTADKAAELALSHELVLGLARRYAGGAEDFISACRGLERALEVASQRSPGANLDAEIAQIMAEVDRLNDEDKLEEGMAVLRRAREARREKLAEEKAALVALLDKGIAQAVLARSVEDAVNCELEKLEIEVPESSARFEALRSVRRTWYERGRDLGLNFDLEVSIALAEACLQLADTPAKQATAQNDFGNALSDLGARESGTARMEEAVAAYRAALEIRTRETVPLDWANAQNNLGTALRGLGARQSGTARLEEAVAACRAALEVLPRETVPLDWAGTQNNLGTALRDLGARESGTTRLEEAVAAYRAALEVLPRETVPLDWAATQNNLGAALWTLGARESGTARLEEAVVAYRAALEVRTRETVPLDWAATQNNLGVALRNLGARESGTARLEEAIAAYRAALEARTRETVPFLWAQTQENMALAELTLSEKTEGETSAAHLRTALSHVDAALEVYTPEDTPFYHDKATELRTYILSRL